MENDCKTHGHHEQAETVAFFDQLAENWDTAEQDAAATIRRVEELDELLNLGDGQELLEVGCGTGQLTSWLAARVSPAKVTAVDVSPKMLEIARTKSAAAEFRLADVCRDPLEPDRYDVVFCFHCVPHFHDIPAAVNNLARSLKPHGRLLVVHLNSRSQINDFHDRVGGAVAGHHLPDDPRWEALLSQAGLKKTKLIDCKGLYLLEAKRGES